MAIIASLGTTTAIVSTTTATITASAATATTTYCCYDCYHYCCCCYYIGCDYCYYYRYSYCYCYYYVLLLLLLTAAATATRPESMWLLGCFEHKRAQMAARSSRHVLRAKANRSGTDGAELPVTTRWTPHPASGAAGWPREP